MAEAIDLHDRYVGEGSGGDEPAVLFDARILDVPAVCLLQIDRFNGVHEAALRAFFLEIFIFILIQNAELFHRKCSFAVP